MDPRMETSETPGPEITILIPVLNEEGSLPELYRRLSATLGPLGRTYEVLFVDDGSTDATPRLLKEYAATDPRVRIVELNRNYGQHAAIFAGFEEAHGEIVVTLDADLQNPPEEIPVLLAKIDEGYDVVGGWRENRQDPLFRRFASFLVNRITARLVGVDFHDYGCMLRAYRREVVESVRQCREIHAFIPALAATYARGVAEVRVKHDERAIGRSKYNFYRLIRLNFDLMTGFSMLPLQLMSFFGFAVALVSLAFAVFLLIRRLVVGPEVEGLFTLFAILFGVVGLLFMGLGLLGEYVARIYSEVRRRPRYLVRRRIGGATPTARRWDDRTRRGAPADAAIDLDPGRGSQRSFEDH
jgi:undecaprenyl-phosphate 4-deoxy-4-formamido-L-arabinose transferase